MEDFRWTDAKTKAAQLLAERNLTYIQIAEICDVSRESLFQWRQQPDFIARVNDLKNELKKQILSLGIANRFKRIERQNDTWNRLQSIIKEREADPSFQIGPGGGSGVMVRSVKRIEVQDVNAEGEKKGPPRTREIIELEVDATLLREIARVEDMAAKELGQAGVITEIPPDLEDYPDASLAPDDARG
jgi:transposase-like protein